MNALHHLLFVSFYEGHLVMSIIILLVIVILQRFLVR